MDLGQSKYHQTKEAILQEEKQLRLAMQQPEAFAPIYEKYYLQIFKFVIQRVDDEDVAGDLTSQVFAKALFKLKDYKFKGLPFSAWLYRVAQNEIGMFFRQQKAQRVVNVTTESLGDMMDEMEEDNHEERLQEVLAAMKKLDVEEVEYLQMRFFEKRSYKEMGEILDITETNARVKTHRVIQKIRQLMKH